MDSCEGQTLSLEGIEFGTNEYKNKLEIGKKIYEIDEIIGKITDYMNYLDSNLDNITRKQKVELERLRCDLEGMTNKFQK